MNTFRLLMSLGFCAGLAARLSVGTAAARGLSPRVEMMTSTGLLLNSFLQGQAVA